MQDGQTTLQAAPRILQVTPVYAPSLGGIEDVVRSLAGAITEAGWVCDVADVRCSYRKFSRERLDASVIFRTPLYGHRLIGFAPALRRTIENYDLIHVHDPQLMAISGNVQMMRGSKPLVLSTHGGFFHTSQYALLKWAHGALTARAALRGYDAILASSETDQAAFAQFSDRVELARNGVNTEKFGGVERSVGFDHLRWIYWVGSPATRGSTTSSAMPRSREAEASRFGCRSAAPTSTICSLRSKL